MPGPEHLRKLKSRRVVHKSTGGVLPRTPEPVDPVGNPPSAASFNTVAHPPLEDERRRGFPHVGRGNFGAYGKVGPMS
jgi:hypothetical protein